MQQTLKGTYDILPDRYQQYDYISNKFKSVVERYGYKMAETPVIENAAVFMKENATSDMVTKEMYAFSMKGKKGEYTIALRPEGTAGIMRMILENKLYGNSELPLKLAYVEPMFRHDHSQKGRQRQFTQMGIENVGLKSALIDAEVIACGHQFMQELGISNIKILINTLGDASSRENYASILKEYFADKLDCLCEDCQNRYHKNPLRILDCKIDSGKDVVTSAPLLQDSLDQESKDYFLQVQDYLKSLNIEYEIDQRLVRGLDYYTDTVFEVVSTDPSAGAQATLFAGGRYDDLAQEMGSSEPLSGIGFAIGLERLYYALEAENLLPEFNFDSDVYVISLGISAYSLQIATLLRRLGKKVSLNTQERSLKSQFKSADRVNAKYICIVGEEEEKNKVVQIKNTVNKTQEEVKFSDLEEYFKGEENA